MITAILLRSIIKCTGSIASFVGQVLTDDLCFATFFAGHVDKRRIPVIILKMIAAIITSPQTIRSD